MKFSNSYVCLGEAFYQPTLPSPVSNPEVLLWNKRLAESLTLSESLQHSAEMQAQIFSGNQMLDGAQSVALAYCGHQFGHLNPQLGDGRAHLLGEIIDTNNKRFDIQLKGSGPTPFSRQGDGRCALGPAIREYIMSEAMHFLKVPTSRCLAVVATGEPVYRDTVKPGAVVTRVASSHIRVGTFQYFAIRKDIESLSKLLDYTIERHFPEIDTSSDNKALLFIEAMMLKQINLIVEWMRVGFIHGVMNTDNTAISGETIDFGPCAMMGVYHPGTVYSSIDAQGRYAFGNQPSIALWNTVRLAECLIPFIDENEKTAIELIEPVLMQFTPLFDQAHFDMLAKKLGFSGIESSDKGLIEDLLETMQSKELDYTQTFYHLTHSLDDKAVENTLKADLGDWYTTWRAHLANSANDIEFSRKIMKAKNPVVIPRNHHVEGVLKACEERNNIQAAQDFLTVLRSPYKTLPETENYQDLPIDADENYQTFCGT